MEGGSSQPIRGAESSGGRQQSFFPAWRRISRRIWIGMDPLPMNAHRAVQMLWNEHPLLIRVPQILAEQGVQGVKDAISFLIDLRDNQLRDDEELFWEFLEILLMYQRGIANSDDVNREVQLLFEGHSALFNWFLLYLLLRESFTTSLTTPFLF
jgi:hypothetical protein